MRNILNYFLVILFVISACSDKGERSLRGAFVQSVDGKTYLIVDEVEGDCPNLEVDGKKWVYKIGEPGQINAGVHTIECFEGGKIEFQIPAGAVFRFDYWGP